MSLGPGHYLHSTLDIASLPTSTGFAFILERTLRSNCETYRNGVVVVKGQALPSGS